MTPAEHAKAIERAANIYATAAAAAALNKPGGSAMALEARESLREAIRAGVGADLFVSDNKMVEAPDLAAELDEVKTVCAQAYQVVGILLSDAGRFDSPEAEKILDNLGEQRLRHTDVLPWESKPAPEWLPIATAPKDGADVLLRSEHGRVADGAWGQPSGWANPNCWVWPYINQEPTHWMPLPAAPKPYPTASAQERLFGLERDGDMRLMLYRWEGRKCYASATHFEAEQVRFGPSGVLDRAVERMSASIDRAIREGDT